MIRAALMYIAVIVSAQVIGCGGVDATGEESSDIDENGADVRPNAAQIDAAKANIDAYIQAVLDVDDPRPPNAKDARQENEGEPFYRFHPPQRPIHGTVVLFHGFSNKPHQMALLAKYLYDNGFNVYAPTLAGQTQMPLAGQTAMNDNVPLTNKGHWLRIQLKSEYRDRLIGPLEPLLEKVQGVEDPLYPRSGEQEKIERLKTEVEAISAEDDGSRCSLTKYVTVAHDDRPGVHDQDFEDCFTSAPSYMGYLENAQRRIDDLDPMPGPIYVVGLSVGGAVALSVAEANPDRVKGAVAYAPYLTTSGAAVKFLVNVVGPLDVMSMNWGHKFPVGAIAAANRFGAYVQEHASAMRSVPTFMVLTGADKAADIKTDESFFKRIGGDVSNKSGIHRFYKYPTDKVQIPHPLVDPREKSQPAGLSNGYWKPLYQETLRFLLTGDVDTNGLYQAAPKEDLPQNFPTMDEAHSPEIDDATWDDD